MRLEHAIKTLGVFEVPLDAGHPAWLGIRNADEARITLKILMGC